MSAQPLSDARTRAFARVIGPYLAFVTTVIIYRAPTMNQMASGFFESQIVVWISGGLLLMCGLIIIAFHQYWRGLAAILISLFGWFLALRGAVLMAAPDLIATGAAAAMPHLDLVRGGFAVLTLIGLYLTYVGWIAKPRAHPTVTE